MILHLKETLFSLKDEDFWRKCGFACESNSFYWKGISNRQFFLFAFLSSSRTSLRIILLYVSFFLALHSLRYILCISFSFSSNSAIHLILLCVDDHPTWSGFIIQFEIKLPDTYEKNHLIPLLCIVSDTKPLLQCNWFSHAIPCTLCNA